MKARSDLEIVLAGLKRPGYAGHVERLLFELEDEGRIELIRMAVLEKDESGKIAIRLVPGRLEDERGLVQAIKTDLGGLAAWVVGKLFGSPAGREANLSAGRRTNINLSDDQINLLAKSLTAGSTALMVLVEGEFVTELVSALRPFILGTEYYRLGMQKTSAHWLATSGKGNAE
jgi:uncharacterized membrane protein